MTKREAQVRAKKEVIAALHAHSDNLWSDNLEEAGDRLLILTAFNKLVELIERRLKL